MSSLVMLAQIEALEAEVAALKINCESVVKHADKRAKAAEAEAERLQGMLDAIKDAADLQTAVDLAIAALEGQGT